MKQIRVRFNPDTPESYKEKTIKKIVKLGWVQDNKNVQLIPANDDTNQNVRGITFFFYWPNDSDVVYPEEVEFAIIS